MKRRVKWISIAVGLLILTCSVFAAREEHNFLANLLLAAGFIVIAWGIYYDGPSTK